MYAAVAVGVSRQEAEERVGLCTPGCVPQCGDKGCVPSSGDRLSAKSSSHAMMSEALTKQMQRKLLGFARKTLYEVQDYVKIACSPNEKGVMSGVKKERMALLMAAAAPIVHAHGKICSGTPLSAVLAYSTAVPVDTKVEGSAVVYVRWNLDDTKTYVGETEHWAQRVNQHYRQTLAHGTRRWNLHSVDTRLACDATPARGSDGRRDTEFGSESHNNNRACEIGIDCCG